VEFLKIKPISKIPYIHLSFSLSAYTSADFGLRWGKRFCIRLEKRPPFALGHFYTILLFVFFSLTFFFQKKRETLILNCIGVSYVPSKEIWVKFLFYFPCVFPIRLLALKYSLRPLLSVESCADGYVVLSFFLERNGYPFLSSEKDGWFGTVR